MRHKVMIRLLFIPLFFVLDGVVPLWAGDNKHLIDFPGKAAIYVNTGNTRIYKLAPAAATAYHQNLHRLVDLLLAQPTLHHPRGVEPKGLLQAIEAPPGPTVPIRSFGTVYFHDYVERQGKPNCDAFTAIGMTVFVNCPWAEFDILYGSDWHDSQGRRIFDEPRKVGEIQGFPLYRDAKGDETLILTRSSKPLWLPLSQEEFIKAWIRRMEKELADMGEFGKDPSDPYRKRLERHQAVLAAMSPVERQAQAIWLRNDDPFEPDLAPPGSEFGIPQAVPNRDWFDPALPRTAIQLVAIMFNYSPHFDPDNPQPSEDGSVAGLRVSEMKRTADWKAVSAALSP
jgi:hypothetical protein